MNALSGLKILVTRPTHQAQELCETITAAGGEVIAFPTLQIKPLQNKELLDTLMQFNSFDIAIFTSTNAVLNTLPYWPKKTPKLIAAIGPATAKALMQFNITADLQSPPPFNSEALLTLPELQAVKNLSIVIFSGEGGRELLEKNLIKRGAHVKKIAVYQRLKPINVSTAWLDQGIDIIITTSKESLQNLYDLIDTTQQQRLLAMPLLVISERLQLFAKDLGFNQVILAQNPTDKAILAALKAWYARDRAPG